MGKSLNTPPRIGLGCGSIKGLEGVRGDWRENIGGVEWEDEKGLRCGEGRVAADF